MTTQTEPISTIMKSPRRTLSDPDKLLNICSASDLIANPFLALAVLVFLDGATVVYYQLLGQWSLSLEFILDDAGPIIILFTFLTLLSLFFWVFLRAISEGLCLLVDIFGKSGLHGGTSE